MADAKPQPPDGSPAGAWRAPAVDVEAIAAAHAAGWRRRFALPQLGPASRPAVLTNAAVISGRSLERITHTWLPLSILGYSGS